MTNQEIRQSLSYVRTLIHAIDAEDISDASAFKATMVELQQKQARLQVAVSRFAVEREVIGDLLRELQVRLNGQRKK